MFPVDVDITKYQPTNAQATSENADLGDIGQSLKFNYETQRFEILDGTNVVPSKIDAIKQWIELYIRTEPLKYAVYNDDFGVSLRDLLGYRLPRGYQVAEIIRRINTGILSGCPNVVSVSNWNCDKGNFSFTVKTDTGEEVVISV